MSLTNEACVDGADRLATMLRERTAEAHQAAERSPLMAAIVRGQISAADYGEFLARLAPVYAALEAGLRRHSKHPVLAMIYFPELERGEALRRDMSFFGVSEASQPKAWAPAARAYVERVGEVGQIAPELLVAHAYTRYLGDLSGGQVIAKQLRRAWAIEGEDGFAFFAFPRVPNPTAFKHAYRAALDNLPVGAQQAEAIVAEASRAFVFNRDLADELWQEIAAK